MSATLEQALFSEYFNCGVLTTEGRTYPVEHLFLEDAYSLTGYNLDPESPAALKSYGRADLKAQHQRKAGSKWVFATAVNMYLIHYMFLTTSQPEICSWILKPLATLQEFDLEPNTL